MQNLILEPLKYYVQHAKGSHERNIDEYFSSLVAENPHVFYKERVA